MDVAGSKVGFSATPELEVPETVAVPVAYPVLVVVTVTVDEAPGFKPVTVINPESLMVALPEEALTAQVYRAV